MQVWPVVCSAFVTRSPEKSPGKEGGQRLAPQGRMPSLPHSPPAAARKRRHFQSPRLWAAWGRSCCQAGFDRKPSFWSSATASLPVSTSSLPCLPSWKWKQFQLMMLFLWLNVIRHNPFLRWNLQRVWGRRAAQCGNHEPVASKYLQTVHVCGSGTYGSHGLCQPWWSHPMWLI